MPSYRAFGGVVRSEIAFPELPRTPDDDPDWVVQRCADPSPSLHEAHDLGTDSITNGHSVRLCRHSDGYRLSFTDTGVYDISADGRRIVWYATPDADSRTVRLDLLGRVFATALHAGGLLALHGSSVAVAEGGLAFLAPKFHGKSTLASALARAGARLASDDAVPVDPASPPMMRPGVQSVRLFRDSVRRLNIGSAAPRSDGGPRRKTTVKGMPGVEPLRQPVPLAAMYLLRPAEADPTRPEARRTRIPPMDAALAMVVHARVGSLFGGSEAPELLERAVRVAEQVPVYRLEVVRDFAVLDAAVQQIMSWHRSPSVKDPGPDPYRPR